MAKRKSRAAGAQAQYRPQPLSSQALREARRDQAQAEANRLARANETAADKRKRRAAEDKVYRAELEALRRAGIYSPKRHEGERTLTLTKSRKAAIRRGVAELDSLADRTVFVAYPKSAKARKTIATQVTKQGGKATRTGVFLPREEGELRRGSTRFVHDRSTGLWEVRQSYTYTNQAGERVTVGQTRFLDGAAALERQEAKLRKRFQALEAGLEKNQAVRFTIGGPNGNVSRASFRTWDNFKARVLGYRRDPAAQAAFMESLTVYVAERESPRAKSYRVPVAWADKRGRKHTAAPENLYPGGLFPKPKSRNDPRRRNKG